MTKTRCLWALAALLRTCSQSLAKGGSHHIEDRYSPQHIDGLPSEIRGALNRLCGSPAALHPFAQFSDNLQTVVLHYEHFCCSTGGTFCGPSGCLHQVYVSSHGHFRLLRPGKD
jgi:hypothetical protein